MPGTPVKIGPFSGGLNTYSDFTGVGDNECTSLVNFNLDMDGSLVSRSPVTPLGNYLNYPNVPGPLIPLCWYIDPTTSNRYLICTIDFSTSGVWAYNEDTAVWSLITNTINATAGVQYADKLWLISNGSNPGGSWTPAGGFVTVSAMQKGTTVCIYKERLFVGGGTTLPNRIYFSNAADFTTWQTSVNFFDARAGDGEKVQNIVTFQDTVVIFKTDSTYLYSYDSSPSRGAVRRISGEVGASSRYAVVEYENSLYVHHKNAVYQIANWNFTPINLKVNFVYQVKYGGYPNFEPTLSILDDLLVVRHYDNTYVFNLRMGVWSEWTFDTDHTYNFFVEVPQLVGGSSVRRYYAGCRRITQLTVNRVLFKYTSELDGVSTESITSYFTTKTFDFNVPYTFKRLFWWGADLLTKSNLTYKVSPVTYSTAVTHQVLSAYQHQQITGTHQRPLDILIDVQSSVPISNSIGARTFVKFLKSLRFRQIYFTLTGTTDGTTNTGPIRVYSLSAFIDNKQGVPKQVN